MPADKRTYVTLHDGMPDHPKIGALSDKAFRVWIELLCWCSRHRTDGKITKAWFEKVATPKVRQELLGAVIDQTEDSYEIHDYLKHQRSAEEIDELSKKRSEIGKKGASKRWQNDSKPVANDVAKRKQTVWQDDGKAIADTDTEEIDKSISNAQASPAAVIEDQFIAFYAEYPRKVGKDGARRAFKAALKKTTFETLLAGAKGYQEMVAGTEERFIAHPSTWLNQGRWADEVKPAEQVSPWDREYHQAPVAAWNE